LKTLGYIHFLDQKWQKTTAVSNLLELLKIVCNTFSGKISGMWMFPCQRCLSDDFVMASTKKILDVAGLPDGICET
jgi:hypothetical protein